MGVEALNHRVSMEFCAVIGPLILYLYIVLLLEAKVLVVRLKATKTLSRLLACVCVCQRERIQHILSLYFVFLGKKLINYMLILLTDLDCQQTDYGLVFMKMMMKLLKSGMMRSDEQKLITSFFFFV